MGANIWKPGKEAKALDTIRRSKSCIRFSSLGLIALLPILSGIVSCSSSHQQPQRTETRVDKGWPRGNNFFHQASYAPVQVDLPTTLDAEYVDNDEFCMTCHSAFAGHFADNVHRSGKCESCHGPASKHLATRGKETGLILSFKTLPPAQRNELCLRCHSPNDCGPSEGATPPSPDENAPKVTWRTSNHAHQDVACTDCHRSHYGVPPGTPAVNEPDEDVFHGGDRPIGLASWQTPSDSQPSLAGTSNNLAAVSPGVCYQCHEEKRQYQEIAGPHQICGPNGFNCTTCHDPHGNLLESSRKDLCLQCHGEGSPTLAWHSSTHDLEDVACTDCHNPHPNTHVPRIVNISHTDVSRPKRKAMSVDQPQACYKCHPDIYGMNSLPSHHPIKEGRMVCTDCHDAHGQFEGNLKADTVNMVCYRCHAEKQGPFIYEHPPVTEDCSYCHNPHGTVANNLLRQPETFLCLRCHSGHRERHGFLDVDTDVAHQGAFFTNCTRCHTQIHGSDLPSDVKKNSLMR